MRKILLSLPKVFIYHILLHSQSSVFSSDDSLASYDRVKAISFYQMVFLVKYYFQRIEDLYDFILDILSVDKCKVPNSVSSATSLEAVSPSFRECKEETIHGKKAYL